jgi:hypothetical protein
MATKSRDTAPKEVPPPEAPQGPIQYPTDTVWTVCQDIHSAHRLTSAPSSHEDGGFLWHSGPMILAKTWIVFVTHSQTRAQQAVQDKANEYVTRSPVPIFTTSHAAHPVCFYYSPHFDPLDYLGKVYLANPKILDT